MKQSLSLFALGMFVITIITSSSCKKSPGTKDMLLGKWKRVQYIIDKNNDGIIDSPEIHPVDSTDNTERTFYSNDKGIQTASPASPPDSFIYTLTDNNYLTLYIQTSGMIGPFHIESISNTSLSLKFPTNWYIWTKE